jgi:hypothetical protein
VKCVTKELNTLLMTALCVLIDDHVSPRTCCGRWPLLTDSELICLARMLGRLGHASVARHAPLSEQSDYHKRLKGSATFAVQDNTHTDSVLPVLVRRHVDHR